MDGTEPHAEEGDLSGLAKSLADAGIDANIANVIIQEGWDESSFRHVMCNASELDAILPELVPNLEVPLLQRAKIRAAWTAIQQSGKPGSQSSGATQQGLSSNLEAGGWAETFAPKLDASKVTSHRKSFLSSYPSEVLTPATMPSLRLLSTAVHQEVKRDYKWVAWKFRMSQQMQDHSLIQRPRASA